MISINEHNSIKQVIFSEQITADDLEHAVHLFTEWASHERPYAIITIIDSAAQLHRVNLPTISKIFKEISGTHLHFYGIKSSNSIASFMAKIVSQLIRVNLFEASNQTTLVQRIKEDDLVFAQDIDEMLEKQVMIA